MHQQYSFGAALQASQKVNWQVDDIIGGEQRLDFSRRFLPESLARVDELRFLNADEKRILNQIRGHGYLYMFGLVEEFILPYVLDHARTDLDKDDLRTRAYLQFASEEAKHIDLFKRFRKAFEAGFKATCAVIGTPQEIAKVVLSHDRLSVALLVLHIEWMVQAHYVGSVKDDTRLDEHFKSLLKHHWMEEVQHAKLDTLMDTWTRKFTYSDANNDGIIVPAEVTVDTAFTYAGYSQPRLELSINNGIELFNRRIRLSALVDHKSKYIVNNNETSFLCQQSTSCKGTSSLDATLWEQARAVAIRDGVPTSNHGYYEKPDFWRLREVSATYNLPDELASRLLRVRGANLNFSARNLAVWTDWTGVDPEQNYSQGDTQNTLLTAGPPTYYSLRLNLRF